MHGHIDIADAVNWDAPLNRGLSAWFLALPDKQRGLTRFRDLCRRYDGTLTSGPVWSGPRGRTGGWSALEFDNTDDYVDLGTSPTILELNSGFAISWWELVKTFSNDYPTRMRIAVANQGVNGGFHVLRAKTDTNYGPLCWGSFTGSGGAKTATAPTIANSVGVWIHFLISAPTGPDNTALRNTSVAYVNGVAQTTANAGTFSALANGVNYIGYSSISHAANCYMDDFRIWGRRSLSANEALAVYQDSMTGCRKTLNWQEEYDYVAQEAAVGRTTKNTRSHPLGVRAGINWRVAG